MKFSIIPKPNEVSFLEGIFALEGNVFIEGNYNKVTKEILLDFIKNFTDLSVNESALKKIRFIVSNTYDREAYKLTIMKDLIEIEGSSTSGHQNAVMTLGQLMASNELLNGVIINDCPRYVHRGFLLDSSRHFIPLEELKKLLVIGSLYKFNTMHWHLTDDQGWRVEIKKYPLLTEKGSKREHSLTNKNNDSKGFSDSGFYSQEDIKEIVEFAKERNIEIIPEIDMPGHVTSVLHGYPELSCHKREIEVSTKIGIHKDILCVGNEDTYKFIFNVLDEIVELFPSKYIHLGGDEVPKGNWFQCPICREAVKNNGIKSGQGLQTWFTNRIIKYLESKNKEVILWNESAVDKDIETSAICQYWNSYGQISSVKDSIRRKHRVIDSDFRKYYLDYPNSVIPLKTTYNHESIFEEKSTSDKLLGIECTVWTELIPNRITLYKQLFPRFMAVAETGWTNIKEKDYKSFLERLKLQEKLLLSYGIHLPNQSEYKAGGIKGFFITIRHYTKMVSWDTLKLLRKMKLERSIRFDEAGNITKPHKFKKI